MIAFLVISEALGDGSLETMMGGGGGAGVVGKIKKKKFSPGNY